VIFHNDSNSNFMGDFKVPKYHECIFIALSDIPEKLIFSENKLRIRSKLCYHITGKVNNVQKRASLTQRSYEKLYSILNIPEAYTQCASLPLPQSHRAYPFPGCKSLRPAAEWRIQLMKKTKS